MRKQTWKAYQDNALTHSAAHYLMAIRRLREERGYARVTDIAEQLKITRGSCSISLRPLKKRGLVLEDEHRGLRLSDRGQRLAQVVERNDRLLEALLRDILGVAGRQAEIDACKIEHLLSLETSMKLAHFLHRLSAPGGAGRRLLAELRRHPPRCPGNAGSCEVCGGICFLELPDPVGKAAPAKNRTRAAR